MKRRFAHIITILTLCIFAGLMAGCSKDTDVYEIDSDYVFEIEPIEVSRIGSHIYYPEGILFDGFENYPGEEEAVRQSLEEKDKGQEAKIYVFNYICDQGPAGELYIQLYGREYVNGVVLDDRPYYVQSEADTDSFTKMFSGKRTHYPSTAFLVKPEKILPKVEALAVENAYSMLMDRGNVIYGTYILKGWDYDGSLYYEFTLNRYSYVKVDAKTGEILEYKFFDGDLDILDE